MALREQVERQQENLKDSLDTRKIRLSCIGLMSQNDTRLFQAV